jgi:putative oxidoreductase
MTRNQTELRTADKGLRTADAGQRSAWGTTLLRVAVGLIFAAHGAQKLFQMTPTGLAGFFGQIGIPLPEFNAYFIITLELLGGLAMIAGLGTRIVAALFAAVMVVAIATVHGAHGFFLPNGYEYNLVLLAGSIALTLQGAGAFAVDNLLLHRATSDARLSPVRV